MIRYAYFKSEFKEKRILKKSETNFTFYAYNVIVWIVFFGFDYRTYLICSKYEKTRYMWDGVY